MRVKLKNSFLTRILNQTKFGSLDSNRNFRYNESESTFELKVGDQTCVLEVLHTIDKMYLVHLSIPDSLQGKGYERKLVSASLNWIRERKLRIVPLCPYVAKYINRNPKFKFILANRFII